MLDRESARIGDARLELLDERCDERFLGPEPRQKGQIDVDGLPRLAPALERHAADEAVAPTSGLAAPLQSFGRAQDFKNGAPSS